MAEPLDEPFGVVASDELGDEPLRLGERLELMEIEALLLQCPHEALDDAVALRLADVGRRDRHPQPLHFVDPRIGDVLRAPVTPDSEPARGVLAEPAEGVAHALPHRFQGRPAIAEFGGVPADDVIAVVIDGTEKPAPAVRLRIKPRRVGAPHLVRPRRGDRAGVRRIAVWWPEAPRGQELVLAHEAPHALAPGGEAAMGQAGADLAIALAMERRGGQHRVGRAYELGVRGRRLGAALCPGCRPGAATLPPRR